MTLNVGDGTIRTAANWKLGSYVTVPPEFGRHRRAFRIMTIPSVPTEDDASRWRFSITSFFRKSTRSDRDLVLSRCIGLRKCHASAELESREMQSDQQKLETVCFDSMYLHRITLENLPRGFGAEDN